MGRKKLWSMNDFISLSLQIIELGFKTKIHRRGKNINIIIIIIFEGNDERITGDFIYGVIVYRRLS